MSKLDDLMIDFGQANDLFYTDTPKRKVLDEYKQPFKALMLELVNECWPYRFKGGDNRISVEEIKKKVEEL